MTGVCLEALYGCHRWLVSVFGLVWFESLPRDEIRLIEPRFQQLREINTTHGIKIVIQESVTGLVFH